jgi:hypothetical protein
VNHLLLVLAEKAGVGGAGTVHAVALIKVLSRGRARARLIYRIAGELQIVENKPRLTRCANKLPLIKIAIRATSWTSVLNAFSADKAEFGRAQRADFQRLV